MVNFLYSLYARFQPVFEKISERIIDILYLIYLKFKPELDIFWEFYGNLLNFSYDKMSAFGEKVSTYFENKVLQSKMKEQKERLKPAQMKEWEIEQEFREKPPEGAVDQIAYHFNAKDKSSSQSPK